VESDGRKKKDDRKTGMEERERERVEGGWGEGPEWRNEDDRKTFMESMDVYVNVMNRTVTKLISESPPPLPSGRVYSSQVRLSKVSITSLYSWKKSPLC
jgi:hypothetical protein